MTAIFVNGQLGLKTLKRGDTFDIKLIHEGTGQSGAIVRFVAKRQISDPDSAFMSKISPTDITVVTTDNSLVATFTIEPSETENLEGGATFLYGFQRTIAGKVKTLAEGSFSIEEDVVLTNA